MSIFFISWEVGIITILRNKLIALFLLSTFLFSSWSYAAANGAPVSQARLESVSIVSTKDQDRVLARAKQVLVDMMAAQDSIPEELLAKCQAIAIYPFVLKAGFLAGGRYGKGIVLKRDRKTGEWGPASFSTIAGVSGGLQIGIQATDLVLLVLNSKGLDSLLTSKFTLGGDIAVSIGPAGTDSEISTDFLLKSVIVSYSRSRGLFAGLALNGSLVIPDDGANLAYYGQQVSAEDILLNNRVTIKPSTQELIEIINEYAARWQKRQSLKVKPTVK